MKQWKAPLAAIVLLLASWASLMAGPATMLFVPAALVGTCLLVRQKYWALIPLMIVLNPLSIFFFNGVLAYWQGDPSLMFMGLPGIESFNPDPDTRCRWSGGGCLVFGDEWVEIEPHNLAVRLMASIFGPPTRSYRGPYPAKDEALALLSEAKTVKISDLLADRVACDDRVAQLETGVGKTLLSGLRLVFDGKDPFAPEWPAKATCVLYKTQCIVLRLQQPMMKMDCVVLIDMAKGKPFAYYDNSSYSRLHFPPVRYTDPPTN